MAGSRLPLTDEEMADAILDAVEAAARTRRGYIKGQAALAKRAGIPQWVINNHSLIPLAQERALRYYPGWAFVVEWRSGKYYLSQTNSMAQMKSSVGNLKTIAIKAQREAHIMGAGVESLSASRAKQQVLVDVSKRIREHISEITTAIEEFREILEANDR